MSGHTQPKVWPTGLSSLAGTKIGKSIINFSDGGQVTVKDPDLKIVGLTYGERIQSLTGSCIVKDIINKLEIEIKYNPDEEILSYMQSFKNMWGKKAEAGPVNPCDTLAASIYRIEEDEKKTELGKGSGSWLSHLEFEGECFWKLNDEFSTWDLATDQFIMPSDSSYRPDLIHLKERQFEEAEKEKVELENLQRKDKSLR